MIPHKNSVSLRCYKTYSLRRFISCNSDNSVHTVIIIQNTCILWQKPCSEHVSTLNLSLQTLCPHKNSVYSCVFSVCILRPIRQVKMNRTAHNIAGGKFVGNE